MVNFNSTRVDVRTNFIQVHLGKHMNLFEIPRVSNTCLNTLLCFKVISLQFKRQQQS